MTQPDLDLNLLVALDVLLDESSVTGAAARLHLSVPAASRTLGRVRRAFGDPILVRAGRGMVPTARALAMRDDVRRTLDQATALLDSALPFRPEELRRRFTVRANDTIAALLAPALQAVLAEQAPGVRLRFSAQGDEGIAELRDGTADVDAGVLQDFGAEVVVDPLFDDSMVAYVADGHPLESGRLTLARLARFPHVSVSRRGRERGPLDDALAAEGLSRRVTAVVASDPASIALVRSSDAVGLISAAAASAILPGLGLRALPIPAALPPLPWALGWHVRHDGDVAHRWLREQVRAAAMAFAPVGATGAR